MKKFVFNLMLGSAIFMSNAAWCMEKEEPVKGILCSLPREMQMSVFNKLEDTDFSSMALVSQYYCTAIESCKKEINLNVYYSNVTGPRQTHFKTIEFSLYMGIDTDKKKFIGNMKLSSWEQNRIHFIEGKETKKVTFFSSDNVLDITLIAKSENLKGPAISNPPLEYKCSFYCFSKNNWEKPKKSNIVDKSDFGIDINITYAPVPNSACNPTDFHAQLYHSAAREESRRLANLRYKQNPIPF